MYTSVCVRKILTITVSWIIHGNEESHTLHFLLFLHTFWFLVKESLSHLFTLFLIYIYRIMQKTEIWDRKLFVYVCMYVYSLQVKSFYFDYFLHCRYQPKTLNIGSISLQRYAAKKNIDNNCKDVLYGICILYCIATKML